MATRKVAPKHDSWLNMVEGFLSKMTRQMLRGICVKSKEELIGRVYKYFDEANEERLYFTGNITLMILMYRRRLLLIHFQLKSPVN